jgi:hypothetical protein
LDAILTNELSVDEWKLYHQRCGKQKLERRSSLILQDVVLEYAGTHIDSNRINDLLVSNDMAINQSSPEA